MGYDTEVWRVIPSFSVYEASTWGNIRRIVPATSKRFGKNLKSWIDREGYRYVSLCIGHKVYRRSVHSLVAATFLGPCPAGFEVNHKDTNKLNNRSDNFEYMTGLQNIQHGIAMGACRNKRRGKEHPRALFDDQDIREIRRLRKQGWSYHKLMRKFIASYGGIRNICVEKTWAHVK